MTAARWSSIDAESAASSSSVEVWAESSRRWTSVSSSRAFTPSKKRCARSALVPASWSPSRESTPFASRFRPKQNHAYHLLAIAR